LLEALAEELPADSIRFLSKLAAIESQEQGGGASIAVMHLEDGTTIKSKVLIGCDGLHSIVARWLGLAEPGLFRAISCARFGRFSSRPWI